MMIHFEIPGKPFAKQRPRTGKGFTYTPAKTVNYEAHVKACFIAAYPQHTPIADIPLSLTVIAFWPIPKGKLKKYSEQTPRASRPDWDNVGKIISDALNGLAYQDDAQIVRASVCKLYSPRPRVEVWIEEFTVGLLAG